VRVYLASDHAGFELKAALAERIPQLGHEVVDCGTHEYRSDDDYPPWCIYAAERVVADEGSLGVVIGGSGNGEQIAANKVTGTRAALIWNTDTARLCREHNDANIAGVGARQHTVPEAIALVEVFLATPFSGDPRHARRIRMVADFEVTGSVDPAEAAAAGGRDDPS
jgi:ribose 5-phosphate isomerase B